MKKQPLKKNENNTDAIKLIKIGSIIVFLISVFLISIKDKGSSNFYITKPNCVGAYSKENLQKVIEFATHQDEYATQTLLNQGDIFIIPENIEVFVIETDLPSFVKIRIKGQNDEFWVLFDSIKSK